MRPVHAVPQTTHSAASKIPGNSVQEERKKLTHFEARDNEYPPVSPVCISSEDVLSEGLVCTLVFVFVRAV